MKKSFLLFLIILSITSHKTAYNQEKQLSIDAKIIKDAYDMLIREPNCKKNQIDYINKFPDNWNKFIKIFHPEDFNELYDKSHYYIWMLDTLSNEYPNEIGTLLIKLSRKAKWDADAPGYIQHTLANFGASKTKLFMKILLKEKQENLNNIITFLADVENHNAYTEYQQIIENVLKLGNKELGNKFITAKQKRQKIRH